MRDIWADIDIERLKETPQRPGDGRMDRPMIAVRVLSSAVDRVHFACHGRTVPKSAGLTEPPITGFAFHMEGAERKPHRFTTP